MIRALTTLTSICFLDLDSYFWSKQLVCQNPSGWSINNQKQFPLLVDAVGEKHTWRIASNRAWLNYIGTKLKNQWRFHDKLSPTWIWQNNLSRNLNKPDCGYSQEQQQFWINVLGVTSSMLFSAISPINNSIAWNNTKVLDSSQVYSYNLIAFVTILYRNMTKLRLTTSMTRLYR